MKYLIVDITNILYRTFYVHKNEDDITVAGLASHTAIVCLHKYYRTFTPHKIILCFDRTSWRKEYTASEECLSKKPYKGNRRQKQTPKEQARYQLFLDHLNEFEELMRDHTGIITLAGERLEADDLIAGVVQYVDIIDDNPECIIVSADKDMIQLLAHKNVKLIDPASGKERSLKEWDNDAGLFMFEKCIRGDLGDNVQSALPRCRKTRIRQAYVDDYERANLMMETWVDPTGTEYVVKDLFQENKLLMDLTAQPDDIQKANITAVIDGFENPGKYSYFHFMKFIGKYKMKKLKESADQYGKMFSR